MIFIPRVADLSHWDIVHDLSLSKNAGLWGIINKSTQGTDYVDPSYKINRQKAADAGLLYGAYHFGTGVNPADQADWFLSHTEADDKTLVALDFEKNPKGNSMSVAQVIVFLHKIEENLGRKAVLYSGNFIKEQINELNAGDKAYLNSHRLWLAQYGSRFVLPSGWDKYWIWQFTGDGGGPLPHNVPGITVNGAGIDLNVYDGTQDQLTQEWAS